MPTLCRRPTPAEPGTRAAGTWLTRPTLFLGSFFSEAPQRLWAAAALRFTDCTCASARAQGGPTPRPFPKGQDGSVAALRLLASASCGQIERVSCGRLADC